MLKIMQTTTPPAAGTELPAPETSPVLEELSDRLETETAPERAPLSNDDAAARLKHLAEQYFNNPEGEENAVERPDLEQPLAPLRQLLTEWTAAGWPGVFGPTGEIKTPADEVNTALDAFASSVSGDRLERLVLYDAPSDELLATTVTNLAMESRIPQELGLFELSQRLMMEYLTYQRELIQAKLDKDTRLATAQTEEQRLMREYTTALEAGEIKPTTDHLSECLEVIRRAGETGWSGVPSTSTGMLYTPNQIMNRVADMRQYAAVLTGAAIGGDPSRLPEFVAEKTADWGDEAVVEAVRASLAKDYPSSFPAPASATERLETAALPV